MRPIRKTYAVNTQKAIPRRILAFQALALAFLGAVGMLYAAPVGLGAVIGGGAALTANAGFALGVFARYDAREPGRLAARMYVAEGVRIGFILLIFGLAFLCVRPLSLPALMVGFLLVQTLPVFVASGRGAE